MTAAGFMAGNNFKNRWIAPEQYRQPDGFAARRLSGPVLCCGG